jgi:RNA polymerase sigma-70 factor, ECF subfamily
MRAHSLVALPRGFSTDSSLAGSQPSLAPADHELVGAARADVAEFAAIYERYRLAVFRYLRGLGSSEDEALDLTATVFERALRSLGSYRGEGGGLAAWLLRIARNAAIDQARKSRRLVALPSHLDQLREERAPDERADLAALRELVAALPDVQRDALVLRYAVGLSAREIGIVIGKREDATRKLIQRALEKLREAFRADE